MAPEWILTRFSPPSSANSNASSPRTKTGVEPRKCTPTIGARPLSDRTRSAIDGIGKPVSLTSGDAAFEALANFIRGQIAADENNAAVAGLVGAPGPLMVAIENHVYTLEHEAFRIVLERKNTL